MPRAKLKPIGDFLCFSYWKNFSDALSGVIFIYLGMSQFCMIGLLYQFEMVDSDATAAQLYHNFISFYFPVN